MSLGLALAGGGLNGIAHIGALKALKDLDIKIDYLSGTSSGALIGTIYALGYDTDEILKRFLSYYKEMTKIPKKPLVKAGVTYLSSGIAKIEGLIPGENIGNIIKECAREKNIKNMNEISIPYAIATVDTISTKECIFLSRKYDLKNENIDYLYDAPVDIATRASIAFPAVFTPCEYKGYNFIDGGTKDNLPIHILKDMGATKTLGLSFKIDEYKPEPNLFAILLRAVDIFSLKDVRKAQAEADLAIEIDAAGTSLLEVDDVDKVFKIGYDTIMNNKEKILKLIEK